MSIPITDRQSAERAIRKTQEIIQKEILAALSKTDFFERAAFFGGTALRIFHRLERFSEDLDFVKLADDGPTDLAPYAGPIESHLREAGFPAEVHIKEAGPSVEINRLNVRVNAIEALLNMGYEGAGSVFPINHNELIRIKFDIDNVPMPHAGMEIREIPGKGSCKARVLDLETLFARKIGALLFRKWGNRIKGRDYFDYLFYAERGIKANLPYLAYEIGNQGITIEEDLPGQIRNLLKKKFKGMDLEEIFNDVFPYADSPSEVSKWTKKRFLKTIDSLEFDASY